jgi:hypothetical protein
MRSECSQMCVLCTLFLYNSRRNYKTIHLPKSILAVGLYVRDGGDTCAVVSNG